MKKKNSFLENIFSVRNDHDNNHKIFTILGVKIKTKRKIKTSTIPEINNNIINNRLDKIERLLLHEAPVAKGKLRELQLRHFELLKTLKTICEENKLTFWIQGGTLLGAYRHQGFIPWDDDLDCGMLRSDLNKLKAIITKTSDIELVDCYNLNLETNFACRMPKLRFKKNPHIFLDIFPYDLIKIETGDNISQELTDAKKTSKEIWQKYVVKKEELINELISLQYYSPDAPIEDENILKQAENIIERYIPEELSLDEATHIIWGIENLRSRFCRLYAKENILPTNSLIFENDIYPVPNNYKSYMKRQYKKIWSIPNDVGDLRHFTYSINNRDKISTLNSDKVIGYTAGAFDLFHIGHLNLLKRAKEKCDYLIVGVTTDGLIEQTKNKRPFIPLSERVDIIKSCRYVDKVVIQDDLDKFEAWKNYRYDILFSGDDWKDSERWKTYEQKLKKVGARIEYFSYTKSTSSTKIQDVISLNSEKALV